MKNTKSTLRLSRESGEFFISHRLPRSGQAPDTNECESTERERRGKQEARKGGNQEKRRNEKKKVNTCMAQMGADKTGKDE